MLDQTQKKMNIWNLKYWANLERLIAQSHKFYNAFSGNSQFLKSDKSVVAINSEIRLL